MYESKPNDGEEDPFQQDFFSSLNPTGKTSGNLTFADLQTSDQQSRSSSQQGQALPLQKMPSGTPVQKSLIETRKTKLREKLD